jgi:proteasome lid subunit RPN8/RPN11
MKISISSGLLPRLTEYCRSKLPEEACGFMIGERRDGEIRAHDFCPVRNAAENRLHRFEMDPFELTAVLYRYPEPRLIGLFHSHPDAPPLPSAHDRQTAWHTLPSYWIVSFQEPGKPSLTIYNKKDFSVVREVCVNDD